MAKREIPVGTHADRNSFNGRLLDEALDYQAANGTDRDEELDAQIAIVQAAVAALENPTRGEHEAADVAAHDRAVDHLYGMLLVSYTDREDLPEQVRRPDFTPGAAPAIEWADGVAANVSWLSGGRAVRGGSERAIRNNLEQVFDLPAGAYDQPLEHIGSGRWSVSVPAELLAGWEADPTLETVRRDGKTASIEFVIRY